MGVTASPVAPSVPERIAAPSLSRRSRSSPLLRSLARGRPGAGLAGGAPVGDPLISVGHLSRLQDGSAAAQARLTAAFGDPVFASAACVARGHLMPYRPVHLHHPLEQREHALEVVDLTDRRPRAHAAQKADLVFPVVAGAGDGALVEQGGADRAVGIGPQAPGRLLEVPVRPERVRAEVPDDLVLALAGQQLTDGEPESDRDPWLSPQHSPYLETRTPPALARPVQVP